MNHSEDPNLHSTLELDHDVLNFCYLDDYLCPDVVGISDGGIDGSGQLNFGFGADDIANHEQLFPFSLGARCNGNLTFPSDGQAVSVGHAVDIPNCGGHRRRKNSPLTPPDSDGPDSPHGDQVFQPDSSMATGSHPNGLSSLLHSSGVQLQQGEVCNHDPRELLSHSLGISSEPKRKRKRSSECSETLTTNGLSSLRLGSLKSESEDYCLDSSSSESMDSPDPLAIPAMPDPENSYQCLKWSPFKPVEWCNMYDDASQIIPPPQFRVDADKGFNYSFADEAFVCQKKNHLQVTAYMSLQSEQLPKYVQVENELKCIERFCLHLYGIKMESQASRIGVEQSQADRSKQHYEPLQFHISPKDQAKITVGRLHFSETTANNMRKKGKPNPDQRYFLLVVAVYAHIKNKEFLVCANVSERIIVRASNPGQFENDMEVVWSRGQTTDSVFRMGRVGVNTDRPEEALSIHGNLKLTGRLVHPSDLRVKESIQEVDTREQLRNVSKMKLYRYRYSREYLEHAGLGTEDFEGEDTGVLAQEVKEVLPEAVKESDDLVLSDGKTIERFLVVNKERIFMENVGAVKELCKLTDSLEVRIDELETINQKLQRHRCDTVSTFSSLSLSRGNSIRASITRSQERRKKYHHHHHCHHHHHHCACNRHQGVVYDEQVWCSPKFMQFLIVILVLVVILSIGGMAIIYALEVKDDNVPQKDHEKPQPVEDTPIPTAGLNSSDVVTTRQPSVSSFTAGVNGSDIVTTRQPSVSSFTTLRPPRRTASSFSPTTIVQATKRSATRLSTHKSSSVRTVKPWTLNTTPKTVNSSVASPLTHQTTTREPTPHIRRREKFQNLRHCCSKKNTEYPAVLLRDKDVYYDKRPNFGGSSLTDNQSDYPGLRIVEKNYIIRCSNRSSRNSTLYIPFSPNLPFQPVTLEINSTLKSLVLLCSKNFKYECPEQKQQPQFSTSLKQDTWEKSHTWKLPVAYYYQSTFHFRLVYSKRPVNVTCQATPQPSGPPIRDFYFHFIRKCN